MQPELHSATVQAVAKAQPAHGSPCQQLQPGAPAASSDLPALPQCPEPLPALSSELRDVRDEHNEEVTVMNCMSNYMLQFPPTHPVKCRLGGGIPNNNLVVCFN